MIKKIIACGDIHIRNLRRMDETYDMLNNFINECKEYVGNNGLSDDEVRIVVAGDLFENKINVSNEANLAASWFLTELSEICPVIVICGNHDYLANNLTRVDSITPIVSIGRNGRIYYMDSLLEFASGIYVDDNIAWCLFSTFDGFRRPSSIGEVEKEVKYVGLIHADINGAVSDTNNVSDKGLDPVLFDGCDFVIAGHIHKHQEIKKNGVKTVYCSSLIQQNNGESIHGHGYVIWDVEDCDYEFIELVNNDYGFYKFSINSIEDIEDDKEVLINN